MKPVGLIGNSGGIVSSEPLSHLRVLGLLGIASTQQQQHMILILLK